MSDAIPGLLIVHDSARARAVIATAAGASGRWQPVVAANQSIARAKLTTISVQAALVQVDNVGDHCAFIRLLREHSIHVIAMAAGGATGRVAVSARAAGANAVVAPPAPPQFELPTEVFAKLPHPLHGVAASHSTQRLTMSAELGGSGQGESRGLYDLGVLIAIGASTGGPDALTQLIPALPAHCPPVLVVQHMPPEATRSLAERLNEISTAQVREAQPGERPQRGVVLIAPGGFHMRLCHGSDGAHIELSDRDTQCPHKPCVDELFQSVAKEAGVRGVGVLLTGMGSDGAQGLLAMRQAGARTMAQDEQSCAVFGMPARAIERGAADTVLPLSAIAHEVLRASGIRV